MISCMPLECYLSGRWVEVQNPRCMRAAYRAATEAAIDLGIEVPHIRFYYRPLNETLFGYTNGEEIALASDMSDDFATRVVRHDMRHVWQRQRLEWRNKNERERENDACLYQLEFALRR